MFGISFFQSVLQRLRDEQDAEMLGEATGGPGTVIGTTSGFVPETSSGTAATYTTVQRAYCELTPTESPAPFAIPDFLKRISLAEVASELALGEAETALTLAARRRRFAAANHPDRLPAEARLNATLRMKLANMLIDEAFRRIKKPSMPK
ncbi:hypothetical protein GOC91_00455 [Sinorhizobium medicae]|uniref:Uncharacterized protein n=1 Tax=Sinorhizobium medicae TaxID=110321 RepID=A0A6G1WVW4_9HYPH|nr:hypothetical protein [Sinorhizobium medicae]MBO1941556.1 hypothetical protein [Sinorhizobium medicae]MDX0403767.1 hypothetical protein [Sinorhizobium medicae]MDX0415344.1 hypothetical protein [Sinorhizobium medicae]MDX0421326.1 hypothetical protein [Sinorhizobium medicae]MDX0427357.1 hypothetical protein [Sinorhizobium medicae]